MFHGGAEGFDGDVADAPGGGAGDAGDGGCVAHGAFWEE